MELIKLLFLLGILTAVSTKNLFAPSPSIESTEDEHSSESIPSAADDDITENETRTVSAQEGINMLVNFAFYNTLTRAERLIAAGVDINGLSRERDLLDRYDNSALRVAARRGHTDFVSLLLENGAALVVPGEQMSALHEAARYGHYEIAELLLRHDANPLERDNSVWEARALDYALQFDRSGEMIALFIDNMRQRMGDPAVLNTLGEESPFLPLPLPPTPPFPSLSSSEEPSSEDSSGADENARPNHPNIAAYSSSSDDDFSPHPSGLPNGYP